MTPFSYAENKIVQHLVDSLRKAEARGKGVLLTRLDQTKAKAVEATGLKLDYDELSRTALFGPLPEPAQTPTVGIVAAGTSDLAVAGFAFCCDVKVMGRY